MQSGGPLSSTGKLASPRKASDISLKEAKKPNENLMDILKIVVATNTKGRRFIYLYENHI